jgi:serine/threonine protein kinase
MSDFAGSRTAERWSRIKTVVQDAIPMDPSARAAFLAEACSGDHDLEDEVRSLLAAHDEAGSFIERAAAVPQDVPAAGAPISGVEAGHRLGPYLLIRELGRGGMGVVYLAARADDAYRQHVAVKVVRSTLEGAAGEKRFREERQILARLEHANIARLLDGGATAGGMPYLVMEFVDGIRIDRFCLENDLSIDERLALFRSVCDAVQYAHQRLVVHRDLKSSNVLVTGAGTAKLLDFGIAKLLDREADAIDPHTVTDLRAMSFESASPEQVRGESVTIATDVYALGVLLFRLLTGRAPYESAATPHETARAICDETPKRPSEAVADRRTARRLAGDLDTIVLKALQKDPARRYGTVAELADDVARHVDGRRVLARPDSLRYRTTKFVSRNKGLVAAGVLVALSLTGGIAATAWEAHIARVERQRAERRFDDVRRLTNSFLFEFHDAIEDLPGSTKARELVVRRALEYLDRLSREAATDRSLQRELATAYDKVGDVQGLPSFSNLGDTAGALRSHRAALVMREAVDAAGTDPAVEPELVTTYSHLGAILQVMGDAPGARDCYIKAQAIRQRRLARNPSGLSERRSVAVGYHSLGDSALAVRDWNAAREHFGTEAQLFEALLVEDPRSDRAQRDVGLAYKKLGAVVEQMGDRTAALSHYRRAVALDEVRAAAAPHNAQTKLDLAYAYASVGHVLAALGDTRSAVDAYERALQQRQAVAEADPHNALARDEVARAHVSIGEVLWRAGKPAEAVPHLRVAVGPALQRSETDRTYRPGAERLAHVYAMLARVHGAIASAPRPGAAAVIHWRECQAWAQKAIAVWNRLRVAAPLSPAIEQESEEITTLNEKSATVLRQAGASVQ